MSAVVIAGEKLLVVERPSYSIDEATFYLDEEPRAFAGGLLPAPPAVGDVVTAATGYPDEDGDLLVMFDGDEFHIHRDQLAPVGLVIDTYLAS
jgi:hypothetical protein